MDGVVAETNDGAILFVFGDEAAAAAHEKQSASEPEPAQKPAAQQESKAAEPVEQLAAAAASPPAETAPAAEDGEPEAAYEKTRGKKIKEAVKQAPVKHDAKTSGAHSTNSSHFPADAAANIEKNK